MSFIPHHYQEHCIERIIDTPSIGLFLDMGLGKTVTTLTAIDDLKNNRFAIRKVLVIAPKKVAESTWAREVEKWPHLKNLRVSKVLGTSAKRIRALNTPADIYVINRENVVWLTEYYRNAWPFDVVVCDESTSFKNPQAKRFKALKNVRPHIKRMILLTGTPAPNTIQDLWAQVYLLDQGSRLGKNITEFRTKYMTVDKRNRETIFSYKAREGGEEAIKERIGDICISMKAEDYLELPDIIYNTIHVELDKKARDMYSKLEKEAILETLEAEITAVSASVLYGKLLQLCNGAIYEDARVDILTGQTLPRKYLDLHECKLDALSELVESLNGNPCLIFYSFRHDLGRIKKVLESKKLKVRELKTDQDQTDWNNREIDVLLAHPASAAYGLNLQEGGNQIIWFGLNPSLEFYQQANKRLHRQGQTEKVIVHHLVVDGGMDQEVFARLDEKAVTQEGVMRALKARIERVRGG